MKRLAECLCVSVLAALPAGASFLDASYFPTSRIKTGQEGVNSSLSLAQTFTVLTTGSLTEVGVDLANGGLVKVAQPLTLQIRTVTGGLPSEANSGPTVLASAAIAASEVPQYPTFITVPLPDISVTTGEQLAIVLLTDSDPIGYAWFGDLNYCFFFCSNPGTYSGGQAYFEGLQALAPDGSGGVIVGSTTWEDFFFYEPIGPDTGGGPNSDFGFETFISTTPEPGGWLLMLTALPAAAIGRRWLWNPARQAR